ncbi:restriction endonuclease [Actinoplanes sp. NPDC049265]|uniref:restriction endonuclease n=1 Tax=Actinoplanes sp. NPDC049265 TaxID=3363902 RepID=UPI0037247752
MSDAAWHFTPDLVDRVVETIPVLVKSKQQTLDFFRGSGTPEALLDDLRRQLGSDPQSVSKYHITRTVVRRLNEGGDELLAARRELVKRITQWEDFSLSWPNDQDKARGLVAAVRQLVNARDAFTRMQNERDQERRAHIEQRNQELERMAVRRAERTRIRNQIVGAKAESNPQRRGKMLELILSDLCAVEGIQIREPFEIRDGGTPEEQIDGVIAVDGILYLVEVKWWKGPIDINAMSQHPLRLFRRPDARGLFISASGYTDPAVKACKDVLAQKLMVLAELDEILFLLESDRSLGSWLREKATIAVNEREPLRIVAS